MNTPDRLRERVRDFKCKDCLKEFQQKSTTKKIECRFCGGEAVLTETAAIEGMAVHGQGFFVE